MYKSISIVSVLFPSGQDSQVVTILVTRVVTLPGSTVLLESSSHLGIVLFRQECQEQGEQRKGLLLPGFHLFGHKGLF